MASRLLSHCARFSSPVAVVDDFSCGCFCRLCRYCRFSVRMFLTIRACLLSVSVSIGRLPVTFRRPNSSPPSSSRLSVSLSASASPYPTVSFTENVIRRLSVPDRSLTAVRGPVWWRCLSVEPPAPVPCTLPVRRRLVLLLTQLPLPLRLLLTPLPFVCVLSPRAFFR